MFKKSLKALVTGIFIFSLLSTGIVCNADETTTAVTNTTSPSVTTISKVHTNSDSLSTTITTTEAGITTTSINSSIDTTTTSSEFTPITTTTPVSTTTVPVTTTSMMVSSTSYMGQETEYIFKEIDKILYDTKLTSEMKNDNINTYLQKKILSHEVPINVAFDIMRNVKSTLTKQDNKQTMHQDVNNTLNEYIQNANAQNGSSVETYCSNLIKTSFKQGIFSANETIKLLKELHNRIFSKFSSEDSMTTQEATSEYDDYEFNNSKSIVNQLGYSYNDLSGWIYIPNANIDYPIMHYYDDNDYYLQHDMNGYDSSQGCIELDYRCDFNDDDSSEYTNNRLIYGHNLYNGMMFSNLERYKDVNYWEDNKLIEISTAEDQRLYEIYACCSIYGMGDGTQFNYWNSKYLNMDYELFQEYMYLTQETMLYETGNFPTFGEDIITLQTCDGNDGWRIVIFAKRVK